MSRYVPDESAERCKEGENHGSKASLITGLPDCEIANLTDTLAPLMSAPVPFVPTLASAREGRTAPDADSRLHAGLGRVLVQ